MLLVKTDCVHGAKKDEIWLVVYFERTKEVNYIISNMCDMELVRGSDPRRMLL